MLWHSSALYGGSTSSVQNDIRINSFLVGFLRILLRFGQLNAVFFKWKSTSRTNRPNFPLLLRTLLAYALKTRYYWGLLATRVNPYTIGCVWTGELDLTTLRVDGKILNPERKRCGFKTIRTRVDKALKYIVHFHANILQFQMSTLAATTLFALSVACIFHSSRCSKNSIRILQYNKTASQITLSAALLQTSNVFHIFISIH